MSISIARPPSVVYAFASNSASAPAWASGLAGAIKRVGSEWIAESPDAKFAADAAWVMKDLVALKQALEQ